ncbi:trypsin-like serine protease [Streptomyces sp. NPDC102278]|uniref:trypsin-like serine protease n=1 Tax=Streptomyces sp. NPDC102278 TaxID=3366152 RepID=UPI003804309A
MRIRRWLPVTAVATAVAMGTPSPLAAAAGEPPANSGAPYAVEDGTYPYRSNILGATGAELIAGDGNIAYTSCTRPYQIKVWARDLKTNESRICFKALNTGYLSVNIPRAFRIETIDRTLKASVSIKSATQTFDVPEDSSYGFGEADPADPNRAVLLDMRITGSSSPAGEQPAENNATAFAGKLQIGDTRACTAVLIDPRWVVTAKSCFADKPAENINVTGGAPKSRTILTLGRADLTSTGGHTSDIVELVPHTDRDLTLARLAVPATGIAPVALSTIAPAAGTDFTVAGYGRTAEEWAPAKLHSAIYTTGAIASAGFDITAKTPTDATLCKGDAGAPTLRTENGKPALSAIISRSWQNACLDGATADKSGAYTTRVDDLGTWIRQTTKPAASVAGGQQITASAVGSTAHVSLIGTHGALYNTVGNYGAGQWNQSWKYSDAEGMTSVTSVNILGGVRLFGIGAQGKVFGKDFNPTTGQWTAWNEVPGGAEGAKDLTATAIGSTLHLNIIGSDGTLYNVDANYDNGQWSPWTRLDGEGLTALTSVAANNVVHIYGIAGGKVYSKDANYTTSKWSNWVEVPGGAGGATNIAATANGNTVHLAITGSDKALYTNRGDYNTGQWDTWTRRGGNRQLASLTSTVAANGLHVYGIGTDGLVYTIDANLGNGSWGANWVEIPGGLGA